MKPIIAQLFSTALLVMTAMADGFPPAPEGYTWVKCSNNKVGILKPSGWFHRTVKKGDTETHCVSIEDSRKNGIYETGLSLNIVKKVPQKTRKSASVYAQAFIKEACSSSSVLKTWDQNMGPFKGYGCRIRSQKEGDIAMVIHYWLVANDQTGTLFFYVFEAPEATWDQAWKTGEVLLQKLWLDDEV